MKKTEKIFVTLSIISLVLNFLLILGGGILTVLTLSTLSMIYFYLGFALFNDIRLRKIFQKDSYKEISYLRILGAVGAGLSLSITTLGLMFKFQSWPGAEISLGAGLFCLLTVTIIGLIKYSKIKSDYYTRIFKRAAIFGGLGLIVILTPRTSWVELKYRNHPAYVDVLKKAMADPNNQELWDNVEVERQKMDYEKVYE